MLENEGSFSLYFFEDQTSQLLTEVGKNILRSEISLDHATT